MVVAAVFVGAAALLVAIVWGWAAWRSYSRGDEFDLTRLNTTGNFPYGFPLVVPFWRLRRRGEKADPGRDSPQQ